jgi:biopolymer transport protein ExbD
MVRRVVVHLPIALTLIALVLGSGTGVVLAGVVAAVVGARGLRTSPGFALASVLVLPVALAVLSWRVARDVKPFGLPSTTRGLFEITMPVASEARVTRPREWSPAVWIIVERTGYIHHRGRFSSLHDVDQALRRGYERDNATLNLIADEETPWRTVGAILGLVRDAGRSDVVFWLRRFPEQRPKGDEHAQLGIERYEYWGDAELNWKLLDAPTGPPVHILVAATRAGTWGEGEHVRVPSRVRFRYDGRETEDLYELREWMRARRPGAVLSEPSVPWKYTVAVINQIAKLGVRALHLGPLEKLPEQERRARLLPYPR